MSPRRSVQLICVLARSPELASFVKSYMISLKQADPIGNIYRRLAKALSHMTNLHSLSFEIPGEYTSVWTIHFSHLIFHFS